MQDLNLVHSSVQQKLKDEASTEAAHASASLAAAEARISSLLGELETTRETSERELSAKHSQLLQQQQQTLLAEAAAVDARAAQAVEKLTDERNSLQKQQHMLQELHQQLLLQHEQQLQLLQVERDKILEQSLEISRLQMELSVACEESAKLLATKVQNFSRNKVLNLMLFAGKSTAAYQC
jgi:hypothetical protein